MRSLTPHQRKYISRLYFRAYKEVSRVQWTALHFMREDIAGKYEKFGRRIRFRFWIRNNITNRKGYVLELMK